MLSIGELSRRTGVKIPTIRYYEKMGLMEAPRRTEGNQRRYSENNLERLLFIRHARDLGFTIEAILELFTLSLHPTKSCCEVHRIASQHLNSVRERISKLKRLEQELQRIEAMSDEGHIGECHVIQALSDHSLCETEH